MRIQEENKNDFFAPSAAEKINYLVVKISFVRYCEICKMKIENG